MCYGDLAKVMMVIIFLQDPHKRCNSFLSILRFCENHFFPFSLPKKMWVFLPVVFRSFTPDSLFVLIFDSAIYRSLLSVTACNCNRFGSERDDCDQMTGRCMCKALVSGMKCDRCSNGKTLGPRGCDGNVRISELHRTHLSL